MEWCPQAASTKARANTNNQRSDAPPRHRSLDDYLYRQSPRPIHMTEVKRRRRRSAPAGQIAPNEPERDILDQYLYEVSTYPLLKGDEEIQLARKIRAGDQDALQELV